MGRVLYCLYVDQAVWVTQLHQAQRDLTTYSSEHPDSSWLGSPAWPDLLDLGLEPIARMLFSLALNVAFALARSRTGPCIDVQN